MDVAVVHNGTVAITVPITGRVRTERPHAGERRGGRNPCFPHQSPSATGSPSAAGLLAHIDDAEVRSQVLAQKSAFLRTLAAGARPQV